MPRPVVDRLPMNRLTALDVVRARYGPGAYAEYVWVGKGDPPLCRVYSSAPAVPLLTAATFEEAFARLGIRPII